MFFRKLLAKAGIPTLFWWSGIDDDKKSEDTFFKVFHRCAGCKQLRFDHWIDPWSDSQRIVCENCRTCFITKEFTVGWSFFYWAECWDLAHTSKHPRYTVLKHVLLGLRNNRPLDRGGKTAAALEMEEADKAFTRLTFHFAAHKDFL